MFRFSSRRRGSRNHRRSSHKRRGAGRRRMHMIGEIKGRKVYTSRGWRIREGMHKSSGRRRSGRRSHSRKSGRKGRKRGSRASRRFSRRRGGGRKRRSMFKKLFGFRWGNSTPLSDMMGPFPGN